MTSDVDRRTALLVVCIASEIHLISVLARLQDGRAYASRALELGKQSIPIAMTYGALQGG